MGGEGGREPVLLVLFRAFYDTQGGGGSDGKSITTNKINNYLTS